MKKTIQRILAFALCLVMCLSLLPVSALAAEEAAIDETNFPDPAFREYVASSCDKDRNGSLSAAEVRNVTDLDFDREGIFSLQGIEFFTELQYMSCMYNQLTSLDLSRNTKLRELNCRYNQLTSLNVSGCRELEALLCDSNRLTSLDVSGCSELEEVDCENNQLASLNLKGCSELYALFCYGNKIKELDIRDTKLAKLVESCLKYDNSDLYYFTMGSSTCHFESDFDSNLKTDITTAIRFGDQAKPQITKQPKAVYAADGKTASFSLTASGKSLKYRWIRLLAEEGSGWDLLNTTADKLSITARKSKSGAQYACIVANNGWFMISKAAKLTIVSKPKITTQPKSKSVKVGSKATLTLKASGGGLKYQWYYQKPGTTKWVKIDKATETTYTFKMSKAKNGYKYRCLVKNAAGSVYSKTVTVKVKN